MSSPETERPSHYPTVDQRPDFPALEQEILASWDAGDTFQASIDQRPKNESEFVFYDGPPFANGLPHYGHLLTGYVKDVVPRYQTMRGHRVDRRFGWDCHGLPAEMEAERQLEISGRQNIISFGIDKFNDYCRSSVMRYTDEWYSYVTRQARWVDFDHDYKTMDLDYMESVIWAFKQLWDKGLVYEAYRVMPYSWGAETVLSNHEIRLDDATRPRQDPAVTVEFELDARPGDPGPMRIWAWTTTPWTLPSNLALAVGPDIDYAIVELGDRYVVIADGQRGAYEKELGDAAVVATIKGTELVERTYQPLFDFFADHPNAFRVLAGDFVALGDGTGVVHMAPGFGEDDQRVCEAAGIELVVPVDEKGNFTTQVPTWAGVNVFDANPLVITALKEQHKVIRHETYDHNYPHCWRTNTPIIYRATSSWFVEVTALRDRMVELNQDINWIPDHIQDGRFGKWLEGARDWSISRNRFWGSPIPVWRSDDPNYPRIDVYGSLDELEADFGVRPDDLHRPSIDDLVRPNPDDPTGKSMMRRVPEVLDCWFDSGSMPFAQVHYPFENKDWFEEHFPADFIVEYINQTRGWFYTLHVLSTALFDRPPFRNAIGHGIVLAEDGSKLSKSKRNFPDPLMVVNTYGADALRWYLMASPIVRGGDLRISESDMSDVIRLIINPFWNAYSFFCLYANADGVKAEFDTSSDQVLDRYILAKTRGLVEATTELLDAYDLPGACAEISAFTDALNNWYIRRSRDRFWAPATKASEDAAAAADKQTAYNTLYTVLVTLNQVAAPLLPMITEAIYRGLTNDDSVHLTDWPDATTFPDDAALVAAMDRARSVVSTTLKIREDAKVAVRVPLATMTVAGDWAASLEPFAELIGDEVNVKSVRFDNNLEEFADFALKPNGAVLGPKLGGDVKVVFAGAKQGDWKRNDDGTAVVSGIELAPDEYELALVPRGDDAVAALPGNDGLVVLDTDLTDELRAEGTARTFVRHIQAQRKALDLHVSDRIALRVDPGDHRAAIEAHKDWIAAQVLATDVEFSDELDDDAIREQIDGAVVGFAVVR